MLKTRDRVNLGISQGDGSKLEVVERRPSWKSWKEIELLHIMMCERTQRYYIVTSCLNREYRGCEALIHVETSSVLFVYLNNLGCRVNVDDTSCLNREYPECKAPTHAEISGVLFVCPRHSRVPCEC